MNCFDTLREEIFDGKYLKSHEEFGGAGTVITSKAPSERWLEESGRGELELIVMKNAKPLSWLAFRLRDMDWVDYVSKYFWYSFIAKKAKEYIAKYGEKDYKSMLLYVVWRVEQQYNNDLEKNAKEALMDA